MVRLKGFEKLTNVDEALAIFLKALKPKKLDAEQVAIENALGRVVTENVAASMDLPPFDRSAVDGYAVRAEDTFSSSQIKPKMLKLNVKGDTLGKGEARQLWTGNPIPKGTDAVVMLEHTQTKAGILEIMAPVKPGENVSKKGEDIRKGEVAVKAGTRLRSHHLAMLAALGTVEVNVMQKLKVAIVSTGNELVELGEKASATQIVNSNRFLIAGLCHELNVQPLYLGIARDDENDI